MNARLKLFAIAGLMAGLSACAAGSDRYPSLALRPFETAPPAAPAAKPAEPIRPLIDDAGLAAILSRASSAHVAFTGKEAAALRLARASAGQSIESNARAAALVAMADLASARGTTATVLAELDDLAARSATNFAPTQGIDAARAQVTALVAAEDAAMAQLWEVMGS
jgi:hypothetical protein